LTPLSPFLRLIDLSTNTVLATTTNILDWTISWELDRVGELSITVPAGDPGDAVNSSAYAFAQALLRAGSNLTTGAGPLPLLLEISLDGGTAYDSRRLARQPQRTLTAARRTISESGGDLAEASLGLAVIERATYNQIPLQQVLNGATGSLVSDSGWGIRAGGAAIPYLAGILQTNPALTSWPAGAQARLQFTANVISSIQSIETTVNIDSASVLSTLNSIVSRLAGATDDQAVGHWVADTSDATLNLSATSSPPAGTPAANTVTVGNVGSTNKVTFTASSTDDVDETTTARVHTERTTVQSDDTSIYQACNFIGGKSLVGVPDDAHITGLAIINATQAEMSTNHDAWTDALLIVGLSWQDDSQGMIAYYHGDGIYRAISGSPRRACTALAYDAATAGGRFPGLLMGTPWGIYYSTSLAVSGYAPTQPTTWVKLTSNAGHDQLADPVIGIEVEHDPANPEYPVIFAHARGSHETTNAIWRWGKLNGQWQWHHVYSNSKITDFTTSDYQTFWINVEGKDTDHQLAQYHVDNATGASSPVTTFTVPGSATIDKIDRVVQVGNGSQPALDSIWVLVSGDQTPYNPSTLSYPSSAYYLINTSGTWGPSFTNANRDGTLHGPEPEKVACMSYKAFGGGRTIDGTILVNAWLGTNMGALWTDVSLNDATGLNWRRVSLGGLDDFALERFQMGESQTILGRNVNRLYTVADNDLLTSNSSGRWWLATKGRERTLVGVYLSQLTWSINNAQGSGTGKTLPHNRIRTWGTTNADGTNMTTSPVGAASTTHVYVPHTAVIQTADGTNVPAYIPRGLYWERFLDGHGDFSYRLVSQKCHIPGTQISSLAEFVSNQAVSALSASQGLVLTARRFMLQHGQPVVHITIESHFSQTDAALRKLRPTHKVSLVGDITITDISSAGAAVSSEVFKFNGSEALWCLSNQMRKGPGKTVITTTVLSNLLMTTPLDPSQIATGLADQIHNVRVFR
jgi:hypothetical protein